MSSNLIICGVAGRARVGKNLFVSMLKETLASRGIMACSVAYANELKLEVDADLRARYGISAFTQDTAEKAMIRGDLVSHGRRRREESGGTYWIDRIASQISRLSLTYDVMIVEDVRYGNEADWVHSLGGKVVYLARIQPDGSWVPAANPEEETNDPVARARADYEVIWPTVKLTEKTLAGLKVYVEKAATEIGLTP